MLIKNEAADMLLGPYAILYKFFPPSHFGAVVDMHRKATETPADKGINWSNRNGSCPSDSKDTCSTMVCYSLNY